LTIISRELENESINQTIIGEQHNQLNVYIIGRVSKDKELFIPDLLVKNFWLLFNTASSRDKSEKYGKSVMFLVVTMKVDAKTK